MAEALAARHPVDKTRKPAGTTPGRLRRLSLAITVGTIALTVVGASALVAADITAVGVQQRTVPAIVEMQRIHAWLSDADRSAANAYLAGGSEITLSQLQYEADIAAANRELQKASEHNPGGDGASIRLQAIALSISKYAQLVQTASVDDREGIATGTVYLQAGSSLMHDPGGILPQVDALRDLYSAGLDRANLTLQITAWTLTVYSLVAVFLLAMLVRTQHFVRARFRRRRNRRLLTATLILVIVWVASGAGAVQATLGIRAAEHEPYARLANLWTARALTYDANGNEGLALIGRGNTTRFDQAFREETSRLVDRPLTDQMVRDAENGQVSFNGLLADELRAASSSAERDGALHVFRAYRKFLQADAAVRAKAAQGNLVEAATIALGTDQGQLVFAFDELDFYLGQTVQRLQSQFDATIGGAERTLAATAALELVALAIAGLTHWGLRPRLREYTAGR
jgi:hypothetical protein